MQESNIPKTIITNPPAAASSVSVSVPIPGRSGARAELKPVHEEREAKQPGSPFKRTTLLLSIAGMTALAAAVGWAIYGGANSINRERLRVFHQILAEADLPVEPVLLTTAVKELKEGVAALEETVAERDQIIEILEAEKKRLENTVAQRDRTIGTLEADKNRLQNTAAQGSQTTTARSQTTLTLESENRRLQNTIADRDRRIRMLHEAVAERDKLIADLWTRQQNEASRQNRE